MSYCSDLCYFQEHNDVAKYEELQFLAHVGALDDLYLDILSPPFQACGDDIRILSSVKTQASQRIPPNQDESYLFPPASLEILRHYRSRIGIVNGKKIHGLTKLQLASPSSLSTNHIIELAAGNFIQKNSATGNDLSAINHPYASHFSGLHKEHAKDIQLVQDLLSCAEKVSNQQYDSARKLLEECSSLRTNTIQRLVHYFAEALRDKIEHRTGKLNGKHMVHNSWPLESITVSSALASFHQKSPPNQVTRFASIQSVADHLSDSKKVHIIDLGLGCGVQQMIIMQTLAARSDQCPLEHLKITAVATIWNPMIIDEAGIRLKDMAKSLNLNFSFHVIRLEDILDLQTSPLEQDPEETVVVRAAYALESMIAKPSQLESLMRVIRSINPRVMIVSEVEANVNSPSFVNRFLQALFFYGAYFDCLEDCMRNDVSERTLVESNLFGPVIRNTVTNEGEEGMFRAVGISVWREFFARLGMVEIELSELALDHANLVINMHECRDSCTVGLNGKCLIVGWKGTPICSLSAWKFKNDSGILN